MMPIDQLLHELFKSVTNLHIPSRDLRILWSLNKQISSGNFLTKNQAKLLIKILKENEEIIKKDGKINYTLDTPTWSQPFRVITQIRKIFISQEKFFNELIIEFTYNKELKQKISELGKTVQGQLRIKNSKQYSIPLTEKNILLVVDLFKNKKFDIEPSIIQYYNEIKEFLENKNLNFNILLSANQKLLDQVKKEIGEVSVDNLLLYDRRFKFQYEVPSRDRTNKSLTESIAHRLTTKVWVSPDKINLTDLIGSLIDLSRLPILVIFDSHDTKQNIENLQNLRAALDHHNITSNIGIYFRADNNDDINRTLNLAISKYGYNSNLTEKTLVAGISNSKFPKFLMATKWYPKTVISFTNNFRNNKASVYANAVDLMIYYNKFAPLTGGINALL